MLASSAARSSLLSWLSFKSSSLSLVLPMPVFFQISSLRSADVGLVLSLYVLMSFVVMPVMTSNPFECSRAARHLVECVGDDPVCFGVGQLRFDGRESE